MIPEQRNLGEQPLQALMQEHGLKSADLVKSSTEQITHKMVARACKGRWLTKNMRHKIHAALEAASGQSFGLDALFNYR